MKLQRATLQRAGAATMLCAAALGHAQSAAPAAPPIEPTSAPAVTATATAQGGSVRGTVVAGTPGKPGNTPLPGVAITATNTLTGRKYTAATDVEGAYNMAIPRNGRYVLRAELAGFAPATLEVLINGADAQATAKPLDFGLELASRAAAAEAAATSAASTATLRRGLQNLGLTAGLDSDTESASAASSGNTGAAMPSLSGLGDSAESSENAIAISGQTGSTNALANFSEDEIRQRVEDGVAQARASGMIPAGVDPTNAIVGVLGGMMGGGGFGSPGGGGGGRSGRGGRGGSGGGFGGGAFRNFNPTQLHGGLNYTGDYSALDSAPWSATLLPQRNTTYARNTFGLTLAGSPFIPGLVKANPKQFVFLNANLTRNTSPIVYNEVVPTPLERGDIDPLNNPNGDAILSGLTQTVNGMATPTPVYDPATGNTVAFASNTIPRARISPQALYILQHYYPEPNVPNAGPQDYNYNATTVTGTNTANISMRYVRSLGANAASPFGGRGGGGGGRRNGGSSNAPPTLRQSINANFSYTHSASDQKEPILLLSGTTASEGYNVGVGYTVGYGRLSNNATLTWNRSDAETRNYFTDTPNNPAGASAISVPSQGAVGFRPNFYNGLPTSSITNFLSVVNVNPSLSVSQTISFSDFVSWRHAKHNYRFGLDVRRVHQDSLGGNNPLGTFQFSGFNTQSTTDKACTSGTSTDPNCKATRQAASGAGFADFLLGLPQQSTIQAALNKVYLRENVLDWYAQDDFRVRNGLTLNYGIRWEYFGPFYEKNNRLANITGVATQTASIGCVTPGGLNMQTAAGQLTCAASDTRSLIHPDHSMYSPRFAVAWRPQSKSVWLKETVIRAGYGINYNTGQFATFARLLAYEPPFALSENNLLSTGNNPTGCTNATLTFASGFNCSGKLYQNSFGVNPNYRLGLVQVYNADIQRTLPSGIVLNVGYNGSKGSDLDVTRAPNHTASAVTTPNAVSFRYEDSIAASHFNALTVNARKRLQSGISLQATYQYAHSIDNASSFGGGSNASSIQNDARLDLERSNSSFDVRHKLTGNWIYELPVGPNRRFLNKGGFVAAALDGFSLSGNFTFASGRYFTPSYQSTAAQIAAGGNYTLRPDRVFSQPLHGAGTLRSFFNRNAFAAPLSPDGYGTASRYSIEGPGQVLVSAALSRTVKLGDTRSLEARIQASNVFNTVQYNGINTVLSSATFGQVTGAAAMRQIQFTGRYRF